MSMKQLPLEFFKSVVFFLGHPLWHHLLLQNLRIKYGVSQKTVLAF